MATTNPTAKKTRSPKPAKNTSAPAMSDKPADVSVTVAAQAATLANTQTDPANSASDGPEGTPPLGGRDGATLSDLVPYAVQVVSKQEGFRRAGRTWSVTPTEVPIDELSEADLAALLAEPMLDIAFLADGAEKVAG